MVTLKVWHGTTRHDDATVSEFILTDSAGQWIDRARKVGGFWGRGGFVPWHRINYVEVDINAN